MTTKRTTKTIKPTVDEAIAEFFKQFRNQDDRSAVILAAALIDLQLGSLLQKALKASPTTQDALLGERGPLGNLYARSQLAYRLGLIDLEMLTTIDSMRDIRNTFAHRLEFSGLAGEPYASRIREAYKVISWYQPFIDIAKKHFIADTEASFRFRALAALVAYRLKDAVTDQKECSYPATRALIAEKWEVVRMGMRARGELH